MQQRAFTFRDPPTLYKLAQGLRDLRDRKQVPMAIFLRYLGGDGYYPASVPWNKEEVGALGIIPGLRFFAQLSLDTDLFQEVTFGGNESPSAHALAFGRTACTLLYLAYANQVVVPPEVENTVQELQQKMEGLSIAAHEAAQQVLHKRQNDARFAAVGAAMAAREAAAAGAAAGVGPAAALAGAGGAVAAGTVAAGALAGEAVAGGAGAAEGSGAGGGQAGAGAGGEEEEVLLAGAAGVMAGNPAVAQLTDALSTLEIVLTEP